MPLYDWKGIKDGKPSEGDVQANTREEAAHKLRLERIIVTHLDLSPEEQKRKAKPVKKTKVKKVPLKELVLFTRKLEAMVRAGLPLLETMRLLTEQTEHKVMKYVVSEIASSVEGGSSLSDGFARFPQVFDIVYLNLIKAGEASGQVDTFLARLIVGMEKTQAIKKKVKKALTYPMVLLSVAIVVIVIMMIYVVPVFQQMFSGSGAELPAATQLVVDISEFIRDPLKGGMLAVVFIGSIMGLKFLLATSKGFRLFIHKALFKVPLVSNLVRNSALSTLAMIQGNLTAAGVAVLDALEIAKESIANTYVQHALSDVRNGVYAGDPLSALFERWSDIFEPTFSAMIAVGEKTGKMDEMYKSIGLFYEEETESAVSALTEMLEPIMIVFMGGTIGFILVAMYTPMFTMGDALGV